MANALQHGEGDQAVAIRVDGRKRDSVTVSVINAGAIDEDLLPNVFDPFRRGRRQALGLGLGLFIAQQIVHAHNGTIDITRANGTHTAVSVRVPRRGAGAADR